MKAGSGLFDQDLVGLIFARKRDQLMPQLRELQPPAPDAAKIVDTIDSEPSGANRPVARAGGRTCHIPTLDDPRPIWEAVIVFEPVALIQVAFERDRALQVLG